MILSDHQSKVESNKMHKLTKWRGIATTGKLNTKHGRGHAKRGTYSFVGTVLEIKLKTTVKILEAVQIWMFSTSQFMESWLGRCWFPPPQTHEDGVYLTGLMSMHQINCKKLITSSFNVATTGGNLFSLCVLPSRVKFSLKQNKCFWVNSPWAHQHPFNDNRKWTLQAHFTA